MGTPFATIYNCFLGKITDDMYLELTPEDTLRDLQNLIIDAIPGFEFPRKNLYDYKVQTEEIQSNEVSENDFVIGAAWGDISDSAVEEDSTKVIIDRSQFNIELTPEEINILALLMKQSWVQRQVTSIENTRMKYSGSDFKFTSQANHLAKLMSLLTESQRDSFHMQRLYRRRKLDETGSYQSNWSLFGDLSATK